MDGDRNQTYSGHELWYRPVRMATIMWQAAIRKAPDTKMGLRPMLSTQSTAGRVATNMLYIGNKYACYDSMQEDVRNTDDTGGQERDGVARKTEGLEDRRRVVQDSVDTGPLLEEHDQGTDGGTVDQACIRGSEWICGDSSRDSLLDVTRLAYSWQPSLNFELKLPSWRSGYLASRVSFSKRYIALISLEGKSVIKAP